MPYTYGKTLVDTARELAFEAHAMQTDKSGEPYTDHLCRVAARVAGSVRKAAAYLHDTLEDNVLTIEELKNAGFSDEIIDIIGLLTHKHKDRYLDFVLTLGFDKDARAVKLADLADNADESRLSLLDEETRTRLVRKYSAAKTILEHIHSFCDTVTKQRKSDLSYIDAFPEKSHLIKDVSPDLRFVIYTYCSFYKIPVDSKDAISSLEKNAPVLVSAITGTLVKNRRRPLA